MAQQRRGGESWRLEQTFKAFIYGGQNNSEREDHLNINEGYYQCAGGDYAARTGAFWLV